MTAPVTAPATAGDEALCSACIRDGGLCRKHADAELPKLAQPSWPKMIGEPYVCSQTACGEHAKCLDGSGRAAPRAECGCHNCGQRRWARSRAAEVRESGHSPMYLAALERREAARSKRQSNMTPRARSASRLAAAMNGGFTRNRRSA